MAESPKSDDAEREEEETEDLENRKSSFMRPNKKKYEDEIEALTTSIKELEVKQKSLNLVPDGKAHSEIGTIRHQMQEMIEKRQGIDVALRKINTDIAKQNAEMTKVESTLRYKREDKTNETIKKLEEQLKLRNFKLSEEKRIVSEIDALKRSKRALGQYTMLKREVDSLKDKAKKLRMERDHYHNEVRALKQKEDKLRQHTVQEKARAYEIKKELDQLYSSRRTLVAEYQVAKKEYQTLRDEQRRRKQEEFIRKKEENKQQAQEAYEKELKEYESTRKPFQSEIQLCGTLLTYLHRFVNDTDVTGFSEKVEIPSQAKHDISPVEEGVYVLKKKTDENLFEGVRPKLRRNRKDKRRSLSNKRMNHTPETLEQFARLGMDAPASVVDVISAVELLEQKKKDLEVRSESEMILQQPQYKEETVNTAVEKYLESLPPPPALSYPTDSQQEFPTLADADLLLRPKPSPAMTMDVESACSNGPESAICEDSIPNTPEVALDNQPPKFLPASSPTLSYDSGAPSMDSGLEDGKQLNLPTSPTPSEHSTLIPEESPSPIESRSDSLEDTRTDSLEREIDDNGVGASKKSVGLDVEHSLSATISDYVNIKTGACAHPLLLAPPYHFTDCIDQSQASLHRQSEQPVLSSDADEDKRGEKADL